VRPRYFKYRPAQTDGSATLLSLASGLLTGMGVTMQRGCMGVRVRRLLPTFSRLSATLDQDLQMVQPVVIEPRRRAWFFLLCDWCRTLARTRQMQLQHLLCGPGLKDSTARLSLVATMAIKSRTLEALLLLHLVCSPFFASCGRIGQPSRRPSAPFSDTPLDDLSHST
jgi:hypothetical protein